MSVGLIVCASTGADLAGGVATGAVFLTGSSSPDKKYQPATAITSIIPITASQLADDVFFAGGIGGIGVAYTGDGPGCGVRAGGNA